MPRLLRPPISVETQCRVVLRQLGEMFIDGVIVANRFVPRDHRKRSLGRLLSEKLAVLAELLKCEVSDLRLDHDPALGHRKKVFDRHGQHVEYDPAGSDPNFLLYRPHGAQFDGSHDVKTRVRGEHGQLSDIALVKRNRRQEEREGTRPKSYKTRMREKRKTASGFRSRVNKSKAKRKWASRPLRSANRWPKGRSL